MVILRRLLITLTWTMFSMFRYPTAFHGVHSFTPSINEFSASTAMSYGNALDQNAISLAQKGVLPPHSSHPDFGHLTLLVFEAVLEVVCVSLPGYILAKRGLFNQDMQKFAANLNVVLFTPCLSMFSQIAYARTLLI